MVDIGTKAGLVFTEQGFGNDFLIQGILDGKVVGLMQIKKDSKGEIKTRLDTFEKGKGYARPIIEHVIELLTKIKGTHFVYLSEEAELKVAHIFRENGYEEIMPSCLLFTYA